MTDFRALCAELTEWLELADNPPGEVVARARAALAEPVVGPAAPSDEAIRALAYEISDKLKTEACGDVVVAVARALAQVSDPGETNPATGLRYWSREARAAIAAVAGVLRRRGGFPWLHAAAWLEREAGR